MKHKTSWCFGEFPGAMTLAGLVLALTACSGGVGSGEDVRAQQQKDAKALEDLYSSVQGKWEGVVSNPSIGLQPFKAELKLYVNYVQDGTNPDGSPKLRPALRGRFQPVDFIAETDTTTLVGDYDRNGRIILTGQTAVSTGVSGGSSSGSASSGAASGGSVDVQVFSIRGSSSGGRLNLELTRQGGVWGYFEATRVSSDASAPLAGDAAEYRDRFLRIYGPIEGTYLGTMKSVNGNDYQVQISIVIVEQPTGGGGSRPSITAIYKRLPSGGGELEWPMQISYNMQTGEIIMRESAGATPGSGGSTVPGGMILSVSGYLKTVAGKKTLDVIVRNKSRVLGNLEAVRK